MGVLQRVGVCAVLVAGWALSASAVVWSGGRGEGNRGSFPDVTFPNTPAVVWKAYLGKTFIGVTPSNVLVTPTRLVVAYGHYLLGLHPETGEVSWAKEMTENPLGDILLLDNQVIVCTSNGNITARDPKDGEILWSRMLGAGIRNVPVVTSTLLFFTTKVNAIVVLERISGKIVGSTDTGQKIEAGPGLIGESLVLCYTDGEVMREEEGVSRWSYTLPNAVVSLTPVTDGKSLAIVTATNAFYALNVYDRTNPVRWAYLAPERLPETCVLDSKHVYFASRADGGRIVALDLDTGRSLWKVARTATEAGKGPGKELPGTPLPALPIGSPIVFGSQLLVRMDNGLMALLNKETGKVEWMYRLLALKKGEEKAKDADADTDAPDSLQIGVPGLDGNKVYFGGSDGIVYALSTNAPDVDPPTFHDVQPAVTDKGFVDDAKLTYIGAVIEDEGVGLLPAQVTMRLDRTNFSSNVQYDAKTGYYYVGLDPQTPLDPGMHRLTITAKDYRGNEGKLAVNFIVSKADTAERVPVSIAGEFLPKHLRVKPGTIVSWTNNSGGVRTIVADQADNGKPLFTSDAQYPDGIANGETWVWIVPDDMEYDTKLFYHDRLNGTAGDNTALGTGLVGVIEIGDPIKEKPKDTTGAPGAPALPGPATPPGGAMPMPMPAK